MFEFYLPFFVSYQTRAGFRRNILTDPIYNNGDFCDFSQKKRKFSINRYKFFEYLTGIEENIVADNGGELELKEDALESSEAVEQYRELAAVLEPVSIFDGVDRSVFEDGVAFTSDAVKHESVSGESWLGKLGYVVTPGTYWNKSAVVCRTATCGLAIAGITATLVRNSALNTTAAIYTGVDDTVGGTYILFERSASALTGSAISGGTAALTAAGGLVLGGALGSIITALAKKKKKAEADA